MTVFAVSNKSMERLDIDCTLARKNCRSTAFGYGIFDGYITDRNRWNPAGGTKPCWSDYDIANAEHSKDFAPMRGMG